ncbi:hypothetical protein CTAYLR_004191 [Chrysophaeum taylorii]|uniref:Alpha-1,4-N-acetylglucosaminyltransferase n=1 Tax=Chrysophaeum taylorii TaxID=2483200 RepID=A0AAD7XR07_9STRA|nr:hypothetical protein CTAYLR_004191 [Chrysophaeum taylorii]
MLLLLLFGLGSGGVVPVFDNTCWDNDPSTACPASLTARARYVSLAMAGGVAPPEPSDPACRLAERSVRNGGSNVSQCLGALRKRAVADIREARDVHCEKTACLFHTWWDGPLARVVQLFLRSFRATQHPECAKLVVWTPRAGSERSTPAAEAMVAQVESMRGAPVVFRELELEAMAKDTVFEDFVRRAVLPVAWETSDSKREGTKHFSDFLQLFVLHRYGGIYLDADMVLLRDFYPLWGLNFEYQWSFIPEQFNNAVQGLRKDEGKSLITAGRKLDSDQCCRGWGQTLWRAKILKAQGSYGLPCTAFDPFWLRMDGHHTGERKNPSLKYPPFDRAWLFKAPYEGDWYDGAFAIHWHGGAGGPHGGDTNAWTPTFAPDSYAVHFEHIFS